MTYSQGAIVVGTDPFGARGSRPYLILSNARHPFRDEEYIAVLVTTTRRSESVSLHGEILRGHLPYDSFVNPWNVLTIKAVAISKRVAQTSDGIVGQTIRELHRYIERL